MLRLLLTTTYGLVREIASVVVHDAHACTRAHVFLFPFVIDRVHMYAPEYEGSYGGEIEMYTRVDTLMKDIQQSTDVAHFSTVNGVVHGTQIEYQMPDDARALLVTPKARRILSRISNGHISGVWSSVRKNSVTVSYRRGMRHGWWYKRTGPGEGTHTQSCPCAYDDAHGLFDDTERRHVVWVGDSYCSFERSLFWRNNEIIYLAGAPQTVTTPEAPDHFIFD